jgi:hypothetical protein
MDHTVRKPTEIELYPNSMNRDAGFCLSKSWKPLISLKKSPNMTLDILLHSLPSGAPDTRLLCLPAGSSLSNSSQPHLPPFLPALTIGLTFPQPTSSLARFSFGASELLSVCYPLPCSHYFFNPEDGGDTFL